MIKKLEIEFNKTKIIMEYQYFEKMDIILQNLYKKAHLKIGFAKVKIGEIVDITNIAIFHKVEDATQWLAFPNTKSKGKFFKNVYLNTEIEEAFTIEINSEANEKKAIDPEVPEEHQQEIQQDEMSKEPPQEDRQQQMDAWELEL